MSEERGAFTPKGTLRRTPPPAPSGKRPLSSPVEGEPAKARQRTRGDTTGTPAAPAPAPAPANVQGQRATPPRVKAPAAPGLSQATPASAPVPSTGIAVTASSKLEQLECVRGAVKGIVAIASGPGSKLNKTDIGGIFAHGQDILGVVAALELQLAEAEKRAELAEAKLSSTMAQQVPLRPAEPQAGEPKTSFAGVLKMGKGTEPKPISICPGPVLTFYPKEESTENSSESTKAALQKAVDPRAISAQIGKIRRVGNAGVLVQTASVESAERLKRAAPATLRVVEPRRRQPLVALRNVDGDPKFEDLIAELWELNLAEDPEWPLASVQAAMKGAFKRSRRGSSYKETTVVFECSARLREVLVGRGTVYIGWQQVEVCDFVRVTCCNKCQQYGHPEKFCRSKEETCGRCGCVGHRADKCEATILCCATCKRFKRDSAHRTASRSCPARLHAEEQLIQQIQYG